MQRRSTTIFLIGLLTLVLGMAVTFAALHKPAKAGASVNSHGRASGAVAAPDPNAVTIPEGKQALAVALDPVAGTAGVAHAGSHIDVFAAAAKENAPNGINAARMVIQNVEVLRVDGGGATLNPKDVSRVPSGSTVFVLAVNQTQAEKIVFHASFSKLWFSVVPDGQKPVGPTPGVDVHTQLNPEAA